MHACAWLTCLGNCDATHTACIQHTVLMTCLWLAHWGLHLRACQPVKWGLFVCDLSLSFGPLPTSYAELQTGFCKQQQQEQYYLQPVGCTVQLL